MSVSWKLSNPEQLFAQGSLCGPHCDSKVLHAAEDCDTCAGFPTLQRAREVWGINFTGRYESDRLPCPSEECRPLDVIDGWPGNRPTGPGNWT